MNFEKQKERFGLIKAILFCEENLPDDFWDSLDFEQWSRLCVVSIPGTKLRERAFCEAERKARSFRDLMFFLHYFPEHTMFHQRLLNSATTLEELQEIYGNTELVLLKTAALEKMKKIAALMA